MEEGDFVVMQCACCDFKYKKSLQWLEKNSSFRCVCGEDLDVDELLLEVYTSKEKKIYTIYQK